MVRKDLEPLGQQGEKSLLNILSFESYDFDKLLELGYAKPNNLYSMQPFTPDSSLSICHQCLNQ